MKKFIKTNWLELSFATYFVGDMLTLYILFHP